MYKKIIIAAAMLFAAALPASAADSIEITQKGMIADGTVIHFDDKPFSQAGAVYIPLEESLSSLDYTLGWNAALKGTVIEKPETPSSVVFNSGDTHIVGYSMYKYLHPVVMTMDKEYIDSELFADLTGAEVSAVKGIPGLLIPNKYRMKPSMKNYFGDITVLDRTYAFLSAGISSQSAAEYAKIINKYAEELPNVNVYNMLVPDSGEFYAPTNYYKDQLSSFELVYNALKNVTPVPVGDVLLDHAGERIYFQKDHHWTQRGAYYAWKRFMSIRNDWIPELSEFERVETNDFVGSYVKELEQLNVAGAFNENTEYFERFLPKYNVRADVYDDMLMTKYAAEIPFINMQSTDYGSFLYGDTPITVVTGGIPNGKCIAVFKESMGNALVTWAVNNYEKVIMVDIRDFMDGSFDLKTFYNLHHFDDLLVESYPTTIESKDLRAALASLE